MTSTGLCCHNCNRCDFDFLFQTISRVTSNLSIETLFVKVSDNLQGKQDKEYVQMKLNKFEFIL